MEEEKKIIERVQSGDRLAFKQIVEANKKMVYFLAYDLTGNHQDAEDLSQEVFIKMYNAISKFRGEAKISTWLRKIAVNLYLDMRRSRLYKSQKMLDSIEDKEYEINRLQSNIENTNNPDSHLLSKKLKMFLHKLSPKEKSIFIMRHYQEMKLSEISDTMNISVGTVKSLLYRAVQKLKQNLAHLRQEFGLEDS